MTTETGFAEINGARIYYEVAGSGPALVFLHGYTLDRRMWDDQFEHFAGRYRVVRYDTRGFGRSDLPTEAPFSNHDDLRLLLDHLAIDRAHACGLSSGGGIAIDVALECPDRVRSVIAISSALGGSSHGLGPMTNAVVAMNEAGSAGDLEKAKRIWLESLLFAPASRDPRVAERLAQIVGDWSGWQLTHQPNHIDPSPPSASRLQHLAVPVLVMVGELDIDMVQSVAADLENGVPNARRVVMPDVGHMTNMEAPEAVNNVIDEFLASTGG
ncbi:MAG: alpha/beta fold hydrolase [Acidimicrobiales bacterium]